MDELRKMGYSCTAAGAAAATTGTAGTATDADAAATASATAPVIRYTCSHHQHHTNSSPSSTIWRVLGDQCKWDSHCGGLLSKWVDNLSATVCA